MYISDLRLENFRNYSCEKIEFCKGLNIFLGDNAQGKTNLLEAVYYCSRGNSFKGIRDSDIIMTGAKVAKLDAQIIRNDRRKLINICIESGQKSIFINELKLESLRDMKNQFDIVYFWPEHLKVIKEGPGFRRMLIDEALTTIKPNYKILLSGYMNLVSQRNTFLKNCRGSKYFREQIVSITRQMSEMGAAITVYRRGYINQLKTEMDRVHYRVSKGRESVQLEYRNSFDGTIDSDKNTGVLSEILFESIMEKLDLDLKRGYTGTGPHRDDLSIRIDNRDSKLYASQGQQRSLVLSLKLSELELIKRYRKTEPILLLDDVFSELDSERKDAFLKLIDGYQSLITTNDMVKLESNTNNMEHRVYKIVSGRIIDNVH